MEFFAWNSEGSELSIEAWLREGSPLIEYSHAYGLMQKLRDEVISGVRESTTVFCQHPSVYTMGRGLQKSRVGSESLTEDLRSGEIPPDTVVVERGGDLTWHGPGQLVIYPIVDLRLSELPGVFRNCSRDLGKFLGELGATVVQVVRSLGLDHVTTEGPATGVWLGREGRLRKVGALGISARSWVTYHGLSLNVLNSLEPYQEIRPCGFGADAMTTLALEIQKTRQETVESSCLWELVVRDLAVRFEGRQEEENGL